MPGKGLRRARPLHVVQVTRLRLHCSIARPGCGRGQVLQPFPKPHLLWQYALPFMRMGPQAAATAVAAGLRAAVSLTTTAATCSMCAAPTAAGGGTWAVAPLPPRPPSCRATTVGRGGTQQVRLGGVLGWGMWFAPWEGLRVS